MEQTSNRFKNENKNKNKKQLHVYHNSAKFWEYNFCNSHLLYMYFTSEKIQTKYARYFRIFNTFQFTKKTPKILDLAYFEKNYIIYEK